MPRHALINKLHHLRVQTEKRYLNLVSMNELDLFQFPLSELFPAFNARS